jgi:hypothetical protein
LSERRCDANDVGMNYFVLAREDYAAVQQLATAGIGIFHSSLKPRICYDEDTACAHHQNDQEAACLASRRSGSSVGTETPSNRADTLTGERPAAQP